MTLKCMEMLSILYNDKNTSIFWAPVDTNQVTDYLEVIKEPIDLGTITRNLRLGTNNIITNILISITNFNLQECMVQIMKLLLMMSEKFGIIAQHITSEDQD